MDLLKTYTKAQLLDDFSVRSRSIPLILEPDEVERVMRQAVRTLDQEVYSPRHMLLKCAYNGQMVDVTDYHIASITRVAYSGSSATSLIDGEIGLLPFLSAQGAGTGLIENVMDLFLVQRVINGIKRFMNTYDWELWPPDENGREMLQVRNPGSLMEVEFLPVLDDAAPAWELYQKEFTFVSELFYRMANLQNTEVQAQASLLGVSKEASNLVSYWREQVASCIKDWKDSAVVTAMY